jgi:hypothetical protein
MMIQCRRQWLLVQRWMALALPAAAIEAASGQASSLSIRLVPELELTLQGEFGSTNQVQHAEGLRSGAGWQSLANFVLKDSAYLLSPSFSSFASAALPFVG